MRKLWMVSLFMAMVASGIQVYGQRGGAPQVPSPQSQDPGRFPGFPPNAGQGRPETVGQPQGVGQPEAVGRPEGVGEGRPAGVGNPGDNSNPSNLNGQPEGTDFDLQSVNAVDQLERAPEQQLTRLTELLTPPDSPTPVDLALLADGLNWGQFVAATHVSANLGLPFDLVKAHMVDDGMSLGQTIQELTDVDAETALELAAQAEGEAEGFTEGTPEGDVDPDAPETPEAP